MRPKLGKSRRKYNTRRKGSGITSSKPVVKYPALPPSPTNRPQIHVNNISLQPVKNEEKIQRLMPLAKRVLATRKKSTLNLVLKREPLQPKRNEYGQPKSYFTLNNNVGFRPTKT